LYGGIAIRQLALAIDEKGIGMATYGTCECVEQGCRLSHGYAFVSAGPMACRV
jgi:hypothetical protein